MKYKKKPVEVEVIEFKGWSKLGQSHELATDEYTLWLHEAWVTGKLTYLPEKNEIKIQTLEGEMTVSQGDYIIQGVQGEIYPCKPDIFKETYEVLA